MVATVVNLTSASSTVHYFRLDGYGRGRGAPTDDVGDYYAHKDDEHRKASHWRGSGAALLGLQGHVEPGEFRRILEGYVPGTEVQLGRVRDGVFEHRAGVDMTLSVPKSVSLEVLLGGRGSARALRAYNKAVLRTLDLVERRLLKTRRWDPALGRSVQVGAPFLVAATFQHVTNRNNEPQLHTHCVIGNMTWDGTRWRSVEIGLLRRYDRLIGAFFRNELARELRREGFGLRPTMIGHMAGFEIVGWSREALETYSGRRREILDFVRDRGWRYSARTAQAAALRTRKRKREPRREELEARWREVARERGIAKQRSRKVGVRNPEPTPALEIAWRAIGQLEERASVFPVRSALALALAHSPGVHTLESLEAAFAELVRDRHLIPAIRRGVGEAWTTARAAHSEREVVERMNAGVGAAEPLAPGPIEERSLEGLTEGQREAARLILESRDRTVGVQGYAGTGKTVMLRRVAALARGRRAVGLAPSASAARTLARETGLGCRTLQWFLARCREVADGVADAKTLRKLKTDYGGALLVVDEMSLAGTAQARALLRVVDRLDVARLVLVGDIRQLRGVEAGQPFRQLQLAGMATALLDDVRRQRDPDLKAAVLDLIEGAPAQAIERLGGDLHEVPAEALAETAARLWLRLSPEARAGTALLAPTRALRAEIDDAVREGLEVEGALQGGAIEIETLVSLGLTRAQKGDARNWREGDVALFHRDLLRYRIRAGDACQVTEVSEERVRLVHPDGRPRHLKPKGDIRYRLELYETRRLRIREGERLRWTRNDTERSLVNGEEAEVRAIGKATLTLRVAGGRDVAFAHDDPHLRHLAYAYASTVHGAQGQTRERVIAVLDSGHGLLSNQQTFYVQLSRARENAVVLTDNRKQLVETLEANTGERLTALEAIGEAVEQRAPSKAAIAPEEAASFLERLKAKREREAAAAAARSKADLVEGWLEDAAEALAERGFTEPGPADGAAERGSVDGHEYETWYLGLEGLVARGRTVVQEAVESGAVNAEAVARVEASRDRLERILARERARIAERVATERAGEWLSSWRNAADPADPFRTRSRDATVEDGRLIAADPALPDELRRDVKEIVDGHDAREAAINAARPWLRAWERFERAFPDENAALDAPDAPGRIERGRAIRDTGGLPEPHRERIASIVEGFDERRAEEEEERRLKETEADERAAEDKREAVLDAVRAEARRTASDALRESGEIRRELDWESRDSGDIESAVERFGELFASARYLAPDLPRSEASRLAQSVRDAGWRLSAWLDDVRDRLGAVWSRFGRAWVNHRHDALRAGWDAHRASADFHPEDRERHLEWLEPLRRMVRDPLLEPSRHEELVALFQDYDSFWPRQRERCLAGIQRWNDLVARAPGGRIRDPSEYGETIEELRQIVGLDTLTTRERESIRAALREHDERKQRQLDRDRGFSM